MAKNEAQRASNKRSIIRMSQTANTFTKETPLEELETNLDLLDDYWTQFQNAQIAIESTCGKNEIDMQIIEMVDTEKAYQNTKTKIKASMNQNADKENRQQQQRQHQNQNQQGNQQVNQQMNSSKLPKLDVPEFHGTYSTWTTFKDMFQSMVINEPITNVRKLHYLKINTKGEASDIVSEYQTSDDNFELAWKALTERFENRRMIITSHMQILFEQPVLTLESAVSLRLLLRTTQKCLRSLKALGGPTEHWDWLLKYLIIVRLDTKTRRYFELTHTSKEMATWDELIKALENRCTALESENASSEKVESKSELSQQSSSKQLEKRKQQKPSKFMNSTSSSACSICGGTHVPAECKEFLSKGYDGRCEIASKYSLCFKCLKPNHNFRSCYSKCQRCGRKHHVLLHNPNFERKKSEISKKLSSSSAPVETKQNHVLVSQMFIGSKKTAAQNQVLLSTALVKIKTGYGNWVLARAFLDGGSQSCVITKKCVQLFNLRKTSCNVPVTGIGEVNAGTFDKEATFEIMSCYDSSVQIQVKAVMMKSISTNLPNSKFDISNANWSYIKGLQLADPKFNEPGQIDILIGAEHYLSLLLNEKKMERPEGYPVAINTVFGWILSGNVPSTDELQPSKILSIVSEVNLENSLKKFWEIEEIPESRSIKSLEEEKCEKHFDETHHRNEDGRFVVKLPFIDDRKEIGESRSMALKRFGYLEKRFARDPELHREYVNVMRELQALQHMKRAGCVDEQECYYLPHHPVIKPLRLTTKVRVVMDATAKSSNGVSLNENLRIGPRLQQDLLKILIRYRSYRITAAADIEKMFRQILVNEEDRRYQRILWREDSSNPIEEFELTTVTFGISSAPFLAVKSLQELAKEPEISFKAKRTILEDFYMDDLLTGGDYASEVIDLTQELQKNLGMAHFMLRKWISNDSDVLRSIDKSLRAYDHIGDIPQDESWKALGLHWHPSSDEFDYKINEITKRSAVTKRTILAVISSLYDPIGFLAPTIIIAKIFIQKLWTTKLDWDDALPAEMVREWIRFQKLLPKLEEITIPRWIGSFSMQELEIHGFSDASQLAYSAVIYARTLNEDGSYKVVIIIGKSKVAPIKTITSQKLELCGAVLLTRLMNYVDKSLQMYRIKMFAWCDNTTVLDWLRKSPSTWKTFVANRVSEIQTTIPTVDWNYISSEDNPADCATRGVDASELKCHPLWWNGPSWLSLEEKHWPTFIRTEDSEAEKEARKSIVSSQIVISENDMEKLSNKFSSLRKLKLVTA